MRNGPLLRQGSFFYVLSGLWRRSPLMNSERCEIVVERAKGPKTRCCALAQWNKTCFRHRELAAPLEVSLVTHCSDSDDHHRVVS